MKEVFSMISNDLGKVLHDKATRGMTLSAEEQVQLQTALREFPWKPLDVVFASCGHFP